MSDFDIEALKLRLANSKNDLCQEAASALRAQQAEIERLKGEYARGINAALSVPREFDDLVSASSIYALLQKQKEGE